MGWGWDTAESRQEAEPPFPHPAGSQSDVERVPQEPEMLHRGLQWSKGQSWKWRREITQPANDSLSPTLQWHAFGWNWKNPGFSNIKTKANQQVVFKTFPLCTLQACSATGPGYGVSSSSRYETSTWSKTKNTPPTNKLECKTQARRLKSREATAPLPPRRHLSYLPSARKWLRSTPAPVRLALLCPLLPGLRKLGASCQFVWFLWEHPVVAWLYQPGSCFFPLPSPVHSLNL